jgi:predicted nucleic acid-binding protein
MSGSKMMLDTNIALYLLGGDKVLSAVLDEKEVFVSVISEMEMLGYPGISPEEILRIKSFLADTSIVELTPEVKNKTIELR